MSYGRSFQQQSAPSPWASGAPPYNPHLQQPMSQQHQHPVMHQPGGYGAPPGPPAFSAGPYGQSVSHYGAPMSGLAYAGPYASAPMARNGPGGPVHQQQRQSAPIGNRNSFNAGVAGGKRPGPSYDNGPVIKRPNRPGNVNQQSGNNRNWTNNNRPVQVQNQNKNTNQNNSTNRNVQSNGNANQNNNKNRNQQNKQQNQQSKQQNNQQNKQQNQQKGKEGAEAQAKHIVPFNGFVCKLCTEYLKDKGARAEHVKSDGHKAKVAEFDAANKITQNSEQVKEKAAAPAPADSEPAAASAVVVDAVTAAPDTEKSESSAKESEVTAEKPQPQVALKDETSAAAAATRPASC